MKKKIIILALILISGISLVRSQPVTGIIPADMSSYKSNLAETSCIRDGNNLVFSVKAITGSSPRDTDQIVIRIKFTGNTRKEFEAFAGAGAMVGQLKLKLVNGSTGKSIELKPDKNGDFSASADQDWEEFAVTFNEFKLNGQTIGTGYKTRRN